MESLGYLLREIKNKTYSGFREKGYIEDLGRDGKPVVVNCYKGGRPFLGTVGFFRLPEGGLSGCDSNRYDDESKDSVIKSMADAIIKLTEVGEKIGGSRMCRYSLNHALKTRLYHVSLKYLMDLKLEAELSVNYGIDLGDYGIPLRYTYEFFKNVEESFIYEIYRIQEDNISLSISELILKLMKSDMIMPSEILDITEGKNSYLYSDCNTLNEVKQVRSVVDELTDQGRRLLPELLGIYRRNNSSVPLSDIVKEFKLVEESIKM